jgi:hypothetical protein
LLKESTRGLTKAQLSSRSVASSLGPNERTLRIFFHRSLIMPWMPRLSGGTTELGSGTADHAFSIGTPGLRERVRA